MGYYLDLNPVDPEGRDFREAPIPPVFWVLWAITGFALACMGLAAHQVLGGIVKDADAWDWAMLVTIGVFFLGFVVTGIKMAAVKKFLTWQKDQLVVGYTFMGKPFWTQKFNREDVLESLLVNKRPAANFAPLEHDDSQYYVRGHWRINLKTKAGKTIVLDRNVEKEALAALDSQLKAWLSLSF